MSDPFDDDPDDALEPEDAESEEGEFDGASSPPGPSMPGPSAPDISAPEPSMPETGIDIDYEDVDPALQTLFWKLVLLIKITLLCLTLGVLFIVFDEEAALGRLLLAFGIILSIYSVYSYRTGMARIDDGEFEVEGTDDDGERQAAETGETES